MSNDETSLLTATNNIYVLFSAYLCFILSASLSLLRSLFVSLSKKGKETGDVDVFSMSGLTVGSCSTQLSCQQPNTTVNSTACALDIATYSSYCIFFSLLLHLCDAHWLVGCSSLQLLAAGWCCRRCVCDISFFLPSASVRHTPHIKKKKKKNSIFFFLFFLFVSFQKRDSLNSTL